MNLDLKRITTHKVSVWTSIVLSSTYGFSKKYNANFVINENIDYENTNFSDINSKNLISKNIIERYNIYQENLSCI